MKIVKSLFFVLLSFLFVACGGGGGSSSSSTQSSLKTGYLFDSAIKGVSYVCEGQSTFETQSNGSFTCNNNSTVTFSIASINLGSINLSSYSNGFNLTPSLLYTNTTNNISNVKVINFIRLVQSLDSDNNPANGIEISSTIKDNLVGQSLNLEDENISENMLQTLVSSVGKTLVTQSSALEHYTQSLSSLNISVSNEPYYSKQWSINSNSEFYKLNTFNKNAHINAGKYSFLYNGKGIKVAVIDDGLDVNHEDLKDSIIATFDSNTKSLDVSQNLNERHGTGVTGIIGARKNGIGIYSLANGSDLIFLKYKEVATDSDTIELFNKAAQFGADIINNSWGTGNVSPAVKDKIIQLSNTGRDNKGIIIVFASGNYGKDMGNDEANIPEVISVGSSNKDNLLSSYSNFGENLDIVAPGGEYVGIATLNPSNEYALPTSTRNFGGTSAAAPVVSAAIALLLEKNPNLTRVQVEDILKNSADKIGDISYENGRNNYYGYGKLNLTKAMQLVN